MTAIQLGSRFLERLGDVDDEAISNIAFVDALECIVDPLDRNKLNLRNEVMFPAEIEHFLGFRNSADK